MSDSHHLEEKLKAKGIPYIKDGECWLLQSFAGSLEYVHKSYVESIPRKIYLLLDIDGVLNAAKRTGSYYTSDEIVDAKADNGTVFRLWLSSALIDDINTLAKDLDADILVCSSWGKKGYEILKDKKLKVAGYMPVIANQSVWQQKLAYVESITKQEESFAVWIDDEIIHRSSTPQNKNLAKFCPNSDLEGLTRYEFLQLRNTLRDIAMWTKKDGFV